MHDTFMSLSETLVRMLGHSLWQGVIVGVLVGSVLRLLPAKRSGLRYGVAVGGLAAVVLMCFATWSVLRMEATSDAVGGDGSAVAFGLPLNDEVSSQSVATLARASDELGSDPRSGERGYGLRRGDEMRPGGQVIAHWLSALWLCGAMVMLVRGVLGFVAVRAWLGESLKSVPFDVGALEAIVKELSSRLGLRRVVRIVVSDRINVPAVIGTLWPVILVPPSMLSGVPVEQWQIIIAHELAHVRRWDAIVSLAQMVIESLLFFNPAVWWLSRQVRVEREACCDALAAEICGQPLSVARALVEVASVVTGQAHIAAALAFAEPTKEGELTDRVRRLVDPDQAPRSKVSWFCLGAVFIGLAITAVLLQRGTDLAVRTAAEWMSPKERIEKLVELEAERNGNIIPLADGSQGEVSDNERPDSSAANAVANKITVKLIVKTSDGSNVTRDLSLRSVSVAGHHSSSNTLNSPQVDAPEFLTTLHFPPSQLRIAAAQPGWATAISPVIRVMPSDQEKTIELILTKGTSVEVVVRNEQGQPIPKAWVRQSAPLKLRGSSSGSAGEELQTDEQGRLRMSHIAETEYALEYSLEVQAPGYQRMQLNQEFREPSSFTAESPFVITMKAAQPTSARVIDAATNQPVKEARLRIAHRKFQTQGSHYGFQRRWSSPNKWLDFGISDDAGRIPIDELEEGVTYSFAVVAEGYGTGFLEAKPGQAEQIVKLGPPLKIAGRITGSLERLQKHLDPKKTSRHFAISSRLGEHLDSNVWAEVDPDGQFQAEGFSVGARLMLTLPDERHDIVLKESITDLQLHIKPVVEPPARPMRDVIIRLTGTSPEATARGSLSVSWQHPSDQKGNFAKQLPVRGNEVQLSVPVGAKLYVHDHDIVGYHIKGRDQLEIKAGTNPQIVELPAVPAGGIHGSITRADGHPAETGYANVFATNLPPSEKENLNVAVTTGGSQFLRKVPLGGRYIILAREHTHTSCLWTVSDEVTIDQSNPIAKTDIQLPTGRDLKVKVLDDTGQPVVGQSVDLEVSFRMKKPPEASLSFHLPSETNSTGVATFQKLAVDQPLGPVELTLYCITKPNPFRGSVTQVNASKPIELRMTRGVSANGVVIDSATNKPIPDAEVRIIPRHFDQATFKQNVTTKTDAQGRFQFEGLEPIEYTGYVETTSPKGTILEPYGNGGLRLKYPGVDQHALTAGPKGKPVRWEVIIHPGSKLRPAE